MRTSVSATTRLGAGLVAVTAATAVLASSGESLGTPPLTSWDAFGAWLQQREAPVAAAACLRLAALAVGWYLLAAIVVGVVLRLVSAKRLVVMADRLTVPPLRRLFAGTLTAGLVSTGLCVIDSVGLRPPTVLAIQVPPGGGATEHLVGSPSQSAESPEQGDDEVTMRRLEPGEEVEPTPGPFPEHREWIVTPGQSFWSIAETVLAEAWSRQPTDAEIVPYWHRLIDANRSTLADPANADLIYPRQTFAIPPPSAAGAG